MKKRKAELYEILANKAPIDKEELDSSHLYPETKHLRSFSKNRSGREIIFSLDGAFIIFVVILLLIGTAFFLGYRKGASETKASFIRDIHADSTLEAESLKLVENSRPPPGSIEIPQGKYSLRLISLSRTESNYKKLIALRKKILANTLIASSKLHVFIFDKGKGSVYSLAIGLFSKPEDEMLTTITEYFKTYSTDGKSTEFKNISLERVDDLGVAKTEL